MYSAMFTFFWSIPLLLGYAKYAQRVCYRLVPGVW
jgi:hypothetical protein